MDPAVSSQKHKLFTCYGLAASIFTVRDIWQIWPNSLASMCNAGKNNLSSTKTMQEDVILKHWHNCFLSLYIFEKNVQTCPAQISTKSTPHHHTASVFHVLVNFVSHNDAVLGKRTILWTSFTSEKVLSSQNITFLHTTALHCRYFWQMLSIFFITVAVSMGFLAARRHGRPSSFSSLWRIVIVETLWIFSGCLFFNSTSVIDGYEVTSRFISLSVSGEVRLGTSEPNTFFCSIPDGSNRAQCFWLEQLCPTQMAYGVKYYVTILTRTAHWMSYFDHSKPSLAPANVQEASESYLQR